MVDMSEDDEADDKIDWDSDKLQSRKTRMKCPSDSLQLV